MDYRCMDGWIDEWMSKWTQFNKPKFYYICHYNEKLTFKLYLN